VELTKAYVKL